MTTRSAMKIPLIFILATSYLVVVNSVDNYLRDDKACNCDHCEQTAVIETINGSGNPLIVSPLNKEDPDGDGNLEICARDRDHPDKSFTTLCHMYCHNRCTRFNEKIIDEGTYKRHIATAYRTNYYKLHDGRCAILSDKF